MKKLVIFDMDGTLADTSQGIYNSHRYAHWIMGRPEPSNVELEGVIGGPLLENYIKKFKFSEAEAKQAVLAYRSYYETQGIHEAILYPKIDLTLKQLNNLGFKLAVATLKAESFARTMLKEFRIQSMFDAVYGMDMGDTRTKASIVKLCMDELELSSDKTILVGDSIHDLQGAIAADVSFLGVTYGFGFKKEEKYDFLSCDSPEKIPSLIMKI